MSNMTKRPWTADEIAFLEQSYEAGTPTLAIAGALSRTGHSVRGKAHSLKLKHHGQASHLYTCRIPDDHISQKRYPWFVARDVMQRAIEHFIQQAQGDQPT